jgi:hypothetical protein
MSGFLPRGKSSSVLLIEIFKASRPIWSWRSGLDEQRFSKILASSGCAGVVLSRHAFTIHERMEVAWEF